MIWREPRVWPYIFDCHLSNSVDSLVSTEFLEDKRYHQGTQSRTPPKHSSIWDVSVHALIYLGGGVSFSSCTVFTLILMALPCPQSEPWWASIAGRWQSDLTNLTLQLHTRLASGCLAPSAGRGAKPQKLAWVTFQIQPTWQPCGVKAVCEQPWVQHNQNA
jgi:hypothetical protein